MFEPIRRELKSRWLSLNSSRWGIGGVIIKPWYGFVLLGVFLYSIMSIMVWKSLLIMLIIVPILILLRKQLVLIWVGLQRTWEQEV